MCREIYHTLILWDNSCKNLFSHAHKHHMLFSVIRFDLHFYFVWLFIAYVSHLPHSVEILRLSILDGYSKCIAMCSSWSIASMGGCFQLFPLYLQCVVYCTVYIYIFIYLYIYIYIYIYIYLHIYGHVVVFCRPKKGAYSIKRPNIYQTWIVSIRWRRTTSSQAMNGTEDCNWE